MNNIVTKKEIVSNSVDHLQKEIDRVLRSRKEFFDGESIAMCFYDEGGFYKLVKNVAVKDELIRRYEEAGWNISLSLKKDREKINLVIILK